MKSGPLLHQYWLLYLQTLFITGFHGSTPVLSYTPNLAIHFGINWTTLLLCIALSLIKENITLSLFLLSNNWLFTIFMRCVVWWRGNDVAVNTHSHVTMGRWHYLGNHVIPTQWVGDTAIDTKQSCDSNTMGRWYCHWYQTIMWKQHGSVTQDLLVGKSRDVIDMEGIDSPWN